MTTTTDGDTPVQPEHPTNSTQEPHTNPPHKNTGMAVVAYIIFFIPMLTDAKDDPFVKYHTRQGIVLFIAWLIVSVISWIPPIIFVSPFLHLGLLALMVIGILHAVQGKEQPLPLIGQFSTHIHI